MVLTHILVAVLAIAGYEAIRVLHNGNDAVIAEQFTRAAIVISLIIAAMPLGFLLGSFTVSALTESLVNGLLVLTGSVAVLAVIGLGLYIVAEGEIPAVFKQNSAV